MSITLIIALSVLGTLFVSLQVWLAMGLHKVLKFKKNQDVINTQSINNLDDVIKSIHDSIDESSRTTNENFDGVYQNFGDIERGFERRINDLETNSIEESKNLDRRLDKVWKHLPTTKPQFTVKSDLNVLGDVRFTGNLIQIEDTGTVFDKEYVIDVSKLTTPRPLTK